MLLDISIMMTPTLFMKPTYPLVTLRTRVLVATPEAKIRSELLAYFESLGQEVQATGAADQILTLARLWQPHVILVSDEFTGKSVHQICHELLQDTRASHIPLMMLCDVNDKPTLLRILEMGVSDVITRPIDLEELRWRIEAVRRWSTIPKY